MTVLEMQALAEAKYVEERDDRALTAIASLKSDARYVRTAADRAALDRAYSLMLSRWNDADHAVETLSKLA